MYKIFKLDGTQVAITEDINYITVSDNGSYVPTDSLHALGVAVDSIPYGLFDRDELPGAVDIVGVSHIDGGKLIEQQQAVIEEQQALIELLSTAQNEQKTALEVLANEFQSAVLVPGDAVEAIPVG